MSQHGDWQPIETAPKDGSPVLVWAGFQAVAWWWEPTAPGTTHLKGGWCDSDSPLEPTHCLPLPPPPRT